MQVHTSGSRGKANHGWLKSSHSFSFASYYNPDRMGFGLLRVLNDDFVAPSKGFSTHPHENMEIVSIPLSGRLKHKDSEGNEGVISCGEVQLMSAGTGVLHSEYNDSSSEDVNFLQIWIIPKKEDIAPRYDQKKFDPSERKNQWQKVVSPMDQNEGGVKINQDAYFSIIDLEKGRSVSYKKNINKNGVYIFLIEGSVMTGDEVLGPRDAVGIIDSKEIDFSAKEDAQILAIEVPME